MQGTPNIPASINSVDLGITQNSDKQSEIWYPLLLGNWWSASSLRGNGQALEVLNLGSTGCCSIEGFEFQRLATSTLMRIGGSVEVDWEFPVCWTFYHVWAV